MMLEMETTQREAIRDLGSALRLARRERGLTQETLARRAGVTNVTLSGWERGRAIPRRAEFDAVVKALDAGLDASMCLRRQLETARREQRGAETLDAQAGGDLLWSMRLRKGVSQTDVARAVGVTQAKLSRWERGESWPETELLQALCWKLEAAPEEAAALTTRSLGSADEATPTGPLQPGCVRNETEREEWVDCLVNLMFCYPNSSALLDLTMLGVERRLEGLAKKQNFATALLPSAYAVHARQLLNYGHERQASLWAERGLSHISLSKRSADSAFATIGRSLWFGNVILSARHRARSGTRAASLNAARLIKEWIAQLPGDDWGHRAWGLSHIAHYLAQAGHFEEAIAISRDATRPERSRNTMDRLNRHIECASLLLRAGRIEAAIRMLQPCYTLPDLEPGSTIRVYLVEIECLSALGDVRMRDALLDQAASLCRQELEDWTARAQSGSVPRALWFSQKLKELLAQIETLHPEMPCRLGTVSSRA